MRLTPSQEEALNIERHVCVTAGAGSGKTTVLVERYLKILREGNVEKLREVVALTFTDKAAAEMKDRIVEELSVQEENEGRQQDYSLWHFLEEINSAHISTIHSFCSRILREFPFQAGVPANFSTIQGIDQKLLLQQTIKDTLKEIATNTSDRHRAELTRLLQRYGGQQKLVDFFSDMVNQRDVIEHLRQEIYDDRNASEIRGNWEQSVHVELMATINRLMSKIDVVEFIRCLNPVLKVAKGKKAEEAKKLTEQLETLYEQHPDSPEAQNLLKEISKIVTTTKDEIRVPSFLPKSIDRTEIVDELEFLKSTAKKIKDVPVHEKDDKRDSAETDSEDETDDDFLIGTTHDLFTLYDRILSDYQTAKLLQGKLDHNDLQLKTRDLLRDNEEIRQKMVSRHKYYMVDEYQDTNEIQYELVMLLTNNLKRANLFIVGDPKQSIYKFRGADVRVFKKTKKMLLDQQGIEVTLAENFRSLRDTLGFVNYFFNCLMDDGTKNEFEVQYEPLIKARPVGANGAVEILLGSQGDKPVNEPTLIARHIKNMKINADEVWVREDDVETMRPIRYDDIAILIRSRSHLPDIEHALLEEDVPYLTAGGVGFYQRQEIYDIWNYLNFLDAPSKNHTSLVALLRSPAFGISDTELYQISLQEGADFWDKTQKYQTPSDDLDLAIATLKKHCQVAHRMPVNQLILTIVNETGMIGTLKTGKQGQQRWANYQKLLELARNFDGDENTQLLPNFIEFLDVLITDEPQEGQAPIEASSGAVQIMTVHAAKGLQFPVVILPRLDRKGRTDTEPFIDELLGIGFSPLKPDEGYRKTQPDILTHIKDRASAKEDAEKKRLLYVGTTRACDRLILSGTVPERNMLGWLHENLGLNEEDISLSLPVKLDVFEDGITNSQSFQLQIPISQALAELGAAAEVSNNVPPVKFPDSLPSLPQPPEISAAFSVSELANYARCPLRYQLENLLQIPSINGDSDPNEEARDSAIHRLLARIRRQSDVENLDALIEEISENDPEITSESKTVSRVHANNFLNSGLAETLFNASETYVNQQIHANLNGHIIEGRLDRLFKDETGQYQLIIYNTSEICDLDTHRPEIELYALLGHRRYPEQPTVIVNLFLTKHGQDKQIHFDAAQLQEAQERWAEKISALQREDYQKNLEHCCSCPYADSDGQCIITEAQGEEK